MYFPITTLYSGRVESIDYTPSNSPISPSLNAVNAGDPVTVSGVLCIANDDIPQNVLGSLVFSGGAWGGLKASGAWTAGNPIFWDAAASPNQASSSPISGAYTQTPTPTAVPVGVAIFSPGETTAALTGDTYGYFVKVNNLNPGLAQTIAAAGTSQTTAAALSSGFNFVTGAAGSGANPSVILPAGVAGQEVDVKNSDAANAVLPVYPPASGTINALSANTALNMVAKTAAVFKCLSPGVWYTIPLLPS